MPYTITRYQLTVDPDGKFPLTLPDSTINDTTTSVNLVGRAVSNYGQPIADDLVWLLENFAGPNTPSNPITGQTWFNTANATLNVYDGYTTSWLQVGSFPDASTAITSATLRDGSNNPYSVLEILVNGNLLAIWSASTFIPVPSIVGFPVIDAGLNLNTTLNLVFNGTAVSAEYADMAERYHADSILEPGDLVKLGGDEEITKTTEKYDSNVFGVISNNPGVRLNAHAGDNNTHPFVAMSGRVKCKVVGHVSRGDRLASSDVPGVATRVVYGLDSTVPAQDQLWAVFGRALEDKTTEEVGYIEVVVGVK
jgi:hypothetical protein